MSAKDLKEALQSYEKYVVYSVNTPMYLAGDDIRDLIAQERKEAVEESMKGTAFTTLDMYKRKRRLDAMTAPIIAALVLAESTEHGVSLIPNMEWLVKTAKKFALAQIKVNDE